ncbi:YveK family protein [Kocuria atrinae]|uniref:YveK family protein n=1 Tax=Kocuria atrinae TaxID=592377 RepID=UPI0002F57273|nr:Wzz/FepE/Etk N-terminal domain-containing protein [Kocuria atrinae]
MGNIYLKVQGGPKLIMSQTANRNTRAYERGEIHSSQLWGALRQSWWIILVTTLLGAALGFAASMVLGTTYTSTASGVVVANGGTNSTEALAGENLAKSKAVTFGSISGTTSTASAVIDDLSLNETSEALLQNVKTTVPLETSEVRVAATASTPEEAQRLAETWVDVLSTQAEELGDNADENGTTVELTRVGQASMPQDPSSVSSSMLIAVGGLVGLLLGLLMAIARRHFSSR